METIVTYPYLLELYDYLEKEIINREEMLQILLIIESYVFRRFISEVPTNALNKTFMLL